MTSQQLNELLTNGARDLFNQAIAVAKQEQHGTLTPLHLLRAAEENDFCRSFFHAIGLPLEQLKELTNRELAALPRVTGAQLMGDRELESFFERCHQEALALGDQYISLEHLLLAWAEGSTLPHSVQDFFARHGMNIDAIRARMQQLRKGKKVDSKTAESGYDALNRYCIDVTGQARAGKLDPVIGRHEEIRRVMQILSRRTKNNPVLVGPPGVGKTAIVEGIAQRIINDDVPESLCGRQIFSLDMGLLIAGAKYQGEFEDRLKNLLREVEDSKDEIILFIDEMHMLIGAGAAGGGAMDASNLLKPALARGTLHCIGATTLQEYKKYIEKDAALERRFQKVMVPEPTVEDAISILRGLRERLELHHGIRIKDQALVDAVTLAEKNIADRFLPDKAIDLVDEAAAMVKMSIDSQPEALDKLERGIRQLEIEKVALAKEKDDAAAAARLKELEKELAGLKEQEVALRQQWRAEKEPLEKLKKIKEQIEEANYQFAMAERAGDYAKASEIKYGEIAALEGEIGQAQEALKQLKPELIKQQVDEDDIARVLSRWTGIPSEKLQSSEKEKILQMEEILKKRVVGQDEAIETVARAIQLHRAGLADPNKPIGSFLFLGPTGVGKTEVARTLADFLFNDPNRMIRIDMSEYMERHAVARLIGAPPGYVGYEEGGQLTEQVRRHPYSVVLFDELEKAHPEVFNILLQILDEGRLTDGQGRVISFKNTIIIMTSNIGSYDIIEAKKIDDAVKQKIEQKLQKEFRPEFLNRIDAIVFFRMLTSDDMKKIARIQLDELAHRLRAQHVQLVVDDEVIDWLAKEGYVEEFGARPLKRAIQRYIMVPISQQLLKYPETKNIHVRLKEGVVVVS